MEGDDRGKAWYALTIMTPQLQLQPQPPQAPVIRCRVCNYGQMEPQSKYRMSGPVVAIGFILLIPSVFGMLFSLLFIVLSIGAGAGVKNGAGIGAGVIVSGLGIFWLVAWFIGGLWWAYWAGF
jgi:hypothetical protein